jgi:hypothetical protein
MSGCSEANETLGRADPFERSVAATAADAAMAASATRASNQRNLTGTIWTANDIAP